MTRITSFFFQEVKDNKRRIGFFYNGRLALVSCATALLFLVLLVDFHTTRTASISNVSSPATSTDNSDKDALGSAADTKYPHDDSDHVWHWARKVKTHTDISRKLVQQENCSGRSYEEMYDFYHENGYIIFRSCTLNTEEGIKNVLDPNAEVARRSGARVPNSKEVGVMHLTLDQDIVAFIEYLHGGRRAFPFQTLHFSKGTQQPIHSDLYHFDTMPRTLMAAAWTALEDINTDNGPLLFYPKSHHFGTWDQDFIGAGFNREKFDEIEYGKKLTAILDSFLERKTAHEMKKGDTLIWAAGLCHGGSKQNDMSLTRLSTVTHYFFEGAHAYWSPKNSNLSINEINYRKTIAPCTTSGENNNIPRTAYSCADTVIDRWKHGFGESLKSEF